MSEDAKSRKIKPGLGLLGVLAAMVSVWWFALRPRKKGESSES